MVRKLGLRSTEFDRRWTMDCAFEESPTQFKVNWLSMLNLDGSTEDVLVGTGFLGIEKELDGCRGSMESDRDLRSACAGRSRVTSSVLSAPSSQNIGRSGSSLPGR